MVRSLIPALASLPSVAAARADLQLMPRTSQCEGDGVKFNTWRSPVAAHLCASARLGLRCSILFLNRDKEQIRFQLACRQTDFEELQKAFLGSQYSWQNL